MGCNICNAGRIGYKWDHDLKIGSKKPRDAAVHFHMELDEVLDHMSSHIMTAPSCEEIELEKLISDPEYLLKQAAKIILQVQDWITIVREIDDISINEISQGAKLIKEFRDTLKFIAELQGKLNKGDTYHQQFVQIEGNFNMLITAITGGMLCDDCQERVLKQLEETKLLEGKIK